MRYMCVRNYLHMCSVINLEQNGQSNLPNHTGSSTLVPQDKSKLNPHTLPTPCRLSRSDAHKVYKLDLSHETLHTMISEAFDWTGSKGAGGANEVDRAIRTNTEAVREHDKTGMAARRNTENNFNESQLDERPSSKQTRNAGGCERPFRRTPPTI
jgi:hypothetical protein